MVDKDPESNPARTSGEIQIGSIVALKSDRSRRGAVVTIQNRDGESQYTVFMDNDSKHFYASQLDLVANDETHNHVSIDQAHCILAALQIKHPSLSALYSLNSARIDFVPYQFRPALKIIRADRPRILIADGVGVGKTIEAGLILRELQARHDIHSVLIICPKPLITERKWEQEMRRFDERFTPLDGKSLQHCIDEMDQEGEWPDKYAKAILPYSLLTEPLIFGEKTGTKKRIGLVDLDPPPHFDLVIVDEAHHLRNSETYSHKAVNLLCEHAEAVVFMTATPIQLGSNDLYTLLHMLRPDIVVDKDTFQHMAQPNPHINNAAKHIRSSAENWNQEALRALWKAESTLWGRALLGTNPDFREACELLEGDAITRDERVSLLGKVEGLHTFSRLINRTRRRDIDDFCVRKPTTVEVQFTAEQRALYDNLLTFEERALGVKHLDRNISFMMTTIRRQAASSLFALSPFISDLLERRLSELELLSYDGEETDEITVVDELRAAATDIAYLAKKLPLEDPKFDALHEIVDQKQDQPNNKLIVFSTFRHTLTYLERRLLEKEIRVGVVHGGVVDEERQKLRKRFEAPAEEATALDVLLFSEVGCEGLDYQFCDGMVNYDLPWNPMRIEQRIGRIDRRGQKSEAVAIYNIITVDTIDADIYDRCLWRIGVFKESIGDCEEILGGINQMTIASIVTDLNLTDNERRQKLEQLADNEVRAIQEQRALEDSEHELFGLSLPKFANDEEVKNAESYWLSSQSIERLVARYLHVRCGKFSLIPAGKALKTLRLSQEARTMLLDDFRSLKLEKNPMNRAWEKWLKGDEQQCPITFESECASDNHNAHFIMPVHPLVKQAVNSVDLSQPAYTSFKITAEDISSRFYPFAVYAWEYRGINPELRLVPICEDYTLAERLFGFLQSGNDGDPKSPRFDPSQFASLEGVHGEIWKQALAEHKVRTKECCAFRGQSLRQSHMARVNVVREQLATSQNENIRRMKESQLKNIQVEFERKLSELSAAEQSADIHARSVLVGIVEVKG